MSGTAVDSGESAGALPTFLIVGAAKCGTTSLHRYLSIHPEIQMSARKELKLFSRDDWRDRLHWYREQFTTAHAVRGESSPTYSMYPSFPDVPERIASVIPAARLIYVVRDPIERFIAHYVEERALGLETRALEAVIDDRDSPDNRLLTTSMYARQLKRFLSSFSADQIKVIDQRDLSLNRLGALREVFEFLEVDPSFQSPEFERLHNQRASKVRVNRAGQWLHDRGLLRPGRSVSRRLPPLLRGNLKRMVAEPVDTPDLDPNLRAALEAEFSVDANGFRMLTGKPFEHWSV